MASWLLQSLNPLLLQFTADRVARAPVGPEQCRFQSPIQPVRHAFSNQPTQSTFTVSRGGIDEQSCHSFFFVRLYAFRQGGRRITALEAQLANQQMRQSGSRTNLSVASGRKPRVARFLAFRIAASTRSGIRFSALERLASRARKIPPVDFGRRQPVRTGAEMETSGIH